MSRSHSAALVVSSESGTIVTASSLSRTTTARRNSSESGAATSATSPCEREGALREKATDGSSWTRSNRSSRRARRAWQRGQVLMCEACSLVWLLLKRSLLEGQEESIIRSHLTHKRDP